MQRGPRRSAAPGAVSDPIVRSPAGTVAPGSQLPIIDGKYQLVRQLGEGGMGAVYEARNRGTGGRVAIKVIAGEALARSGEIVARFRREAMASGAIESQYIAHVIDTGVDPGTGSPYMVMELLSGEDLEHAIRRLGPLPPELALRICAQACLGLQKAHEAQVVHRDIKPANIYLTARDGGEIVAKVLDFGIAKVKMGELAGEAKALTRTGSMLGTPLYMSPEQALAKKTIDHRTDLWSLGAVLYEALCGATPHAHAQTVGELVMSICSQPPRPIQEVAPWVRPEVAAIVHRALAMDPDGRFATAEEMFRAISALLPNGYGLHTSMFVPLTAQPGQPVQAAPGVSVRPSAYPSGPPRASTASGVVQTAAPTPADRSKVALIAVGAVAVLGLGIAGVAAIVRGAQKPVPAAVAPPPAVITAATPAPAVSTATPISTAQETPELPPPPKPPAATTPTPPPEPPASPRRKAGCRPPYYFDWAGRRHPKPECQ